MSARKRRGSFCRRLGVSIATADPVVRAAALLPGRGAVVLRYHSVNDDPVWARECVQGSLVVPTAVFDAQVGYLVARHRVAGIGEIAEAIRDGRAPDRRWVAITFDDGYEDNHRSALPILRKHGATAAFYVTTGAVGDALPLWTVAVRRAVMRARGPSLRLSFRAEGPLDVSTDAARDAAARELAARVKRCGEPEARAIVEEVLGATGERDRPSGRVMMSWDEIRALRDAGMTVGAHSVGHWNLPSLSDADLEREVHGAAATLAREFGSPVEHFAYPNGRTDRHFDARVARVVADAGFVSAVTSVSGAASRSCSVYAIPRVGVYTRHEHLGRLGADVHRARVCGPADRCVRDVARALGRRGRTAQVIDVRRGRRA